MLSCATTVPRNYDIAEFDPSISVDDDTMDSCTAVPADTAFSLDEAQCHAVPGYSSTPETADSADTLFDLQHLDSDNRSAVPAVLNNNADEIALIDLAESMLHQYM